jgi:hypothetical protein
VVFSGFRGLPSDWDGESWLNHVLLGRATKHPAPFYSRLGTYLDRVDMDMLTLNLKACFAILSALERKAAVLQTGGFWKEKRPSIKINAYKLAWRLHNK